MSKLTIEAVLETFADYAEEEHGEDRAEALARAQEASRTAKAEPVTIDRETVRRAILGVLRNATNFPEKVSLHILGQDMGPLTDQVTDAVIAHLAGQPVTGTVEWAVRSPTDGWVAQGVPEDSARRLVTENGDVLMRRTVSEWAEAI